MSDVFHTDVLTMILAGGEGRRLYPLTADRAKPAVPFGGRYRIIDFVLSNFVNSGFFRIKILTQYKSDSLNKHVSRGWRVSHKFNHYIEVVPPQMRTGKNWFMGSADAIYQNMNIIDDERPRIVCVFGADHIYKMDVRQMLRYHQKKNAECTVAAIPVPVEQASSFGIIEIDDDWRVVGWREKPDAPKTIPGRPDMALASMGNYIFNVGALVEVLERDAANSDSKHDFGGDIIPAMQATGALYAYDFSRNDVPGITERELGYWRDVGDIDAYYACSMDLVSVTPTIDLHNVDWPIHSYHTPAPPAKFVFADEERKRIGLAVDSLVSEGVIISGGQVRRSILSPHVRVNSYSLIEDSVLMEGVDVGRHARVRNAVIDKHVKISPRAEIGYDTAEDAKRFHISQGGVIVIPKGAVVE